MREVLSFFSEVVEVCGDGVFFGLHLRIIRNKKYTILTNFGNITENTVIFIKLYVIFICYLYIICYIYKINQFNFQFRNTRRRAATGGHSLRIVRAALLPIGSRG